MENNTNLNQVSPTDDEVIDTFIDGLIAEKGIEVPTDEIKNDLHEELKNQLLAEIDRSLVGELPDEKLDELNQMVAANNGHLDPAVVADTIREAGLDATEIVSVTMQRFRELYLGNQQSNAMEA